MREEKLLKILKSHHVTEKTMRDQMHNTYTFLVLPSATKKEIAQAVALVYKVDVQSVRTLNYKPELKRNARGHIGKSSAYKKALVQLSEGHTIDANVSILQGEK